MQFMNQYRSDAASTAVGTNRTTPPSRPIKNLQYAKAMVFPTLVTFYSVGACFVKTPDSNKPSPGAAMLEWHNYVIDYRMTRSQRP
jgi:hypothetical protein